MTFVAGIFDQKSDVDSALTALYELDIDNEDVVIMRNAGAYGDSQVATNDPFGPPAIPVALTRPTTGATTAGSGAVVAADLTLSDLDLNDEQVNFYASAADDGALVIFVDVDDDTTTDVWQIMQQHNARRANVLS